MTYGSLPDLVARLRASAGGKDARPFAVLAGSGLTAGAVPTVNEILNSVRKALPESDRPELDEKLAATEDPGLKYQAAFTFLGLRQPPDVRDRIIRVATLRAYQAQPETVAGLSSDKLMEYEADTDRWKLPVGVEALGRIWAGLPPRLRGPILTTNFDPLCEIAIKKAGSPASPRILDVDGGFMTDVRVSDVPQVIHMHGYWRESATLSMSSQLTLERPALNGSLRALLNTYTLIVIGYGAWRDALTMQLVEILREQSARDLDVLWCYYGSSEELSGRLTDNEVMSQLARAPGNVQFYTGIDSNTAMPALELALAEYLEFSGGARLGPGRGSLIGWEPVSPEMVRPRGDADGSAALKFFDGRLPNWQDAISPLVPKRDVVRTLFNELEGHLRERQPSITSLIGPSGEGKTTALMQVAVEVAAARPEVVVLFSPDGRVASVDEILSLPERVSHLLVIDDAYRSMDRLRELAVRLQESGRIEVHILAASRDTDWGGAGGYAFTWNRYVTAKTHKLRGISRPDAAAVIQSWEALGPQALGALAHINGSQRRTDALMRAAAEERDPNEGAFLGALLATRYGTGLREHIRELLLRLGDRPIHILNGLPKTLFFKPSSWLRFPTPLASDQ